MIYLDNIILNTRKIFFYRNSLKSKIVIYFLIIPISVFFLNWIYIFWITTQQLEKEVEHSIKEKRNSIENTLKLYKNFFREKCIGINKDARLIFPLNYNLEFPVVNHLKEVQKKETLEDIILIKNNDKEFLVSSSDRGVSLYKKHYTKLIKEKIDSVFFQEIDNEILIVHIFENEIDSNYLMYTIITKKLVIQDFLTKAVLVNQKNNIQSISKNGHELNNLIKKEKSILNFNKKLKSFNHFYIQTFDIIGLENQIVGKLFFGENFVLKYKNRIKKIFYFIPIFFILLAVLIFVGIYLGNDIANPIIEMSQISQDISQGKTKIVKAIQRKRDDEIGILYENFKEMVDNFFKNQNELQTLHNNLEDEIKKAIKEIREKDHMLIKQSKQAAMGEMIGNIAHQWRQPLNAIGIKIQNIEEAYEFEELTKEYLSKQINETMELLQHMSRTIDDFRNFFRTDKEKQFFNLKDIIKKTVHLIENSFENHVIDIQLDLESCMVKGFPNEYSQVLLNILNNAKDAILFDKINNPLIKISLRKENNLAIVKVFNTGKHINRKIMDKIFDPYFTTKHENIGTGIGLYMSKTIIDKNMQGKLYVKNVKKGVEFTIEI